MTDVSNLDVLALAIASSSPKIKAYARAQAAASQKQEIDIQTALSTPGPVGSEGPPGPQGEQGEPGAGGSASGYVARHLVRYVDYVGGDDANSGLEPGLAKKTLQAAYDDLVTVANANYTPANVRMGVGLITPLPGRHDVGSGLVVNSVRPVAIEGLGSGDRRAPSGTSKPTIVSSGNPAAFIKIGHPTDIGHGVVLRNLGFEVDPGMNSSLLAVIDTESVDDLMIENCNADTKDHATHVSVRFLRQSANLTDSAWLRMRDNSVGRMSLYHLVAGSVNGNRMVIDGNVCFYSGSLPMMDLAGDFWQSTVSNNNLEGDAVCVSLSAKARFNTFINNSGENLIAGSTKPCYQFAANCAHNIIVGGNWRAHSSTVGTFCSYDVLATNNIIIGAYLNYAGDNGFHTKVVDPGRKNILISGRGFIQPGAWPTAGMPSATNCGAGAMMYDSTLSKLVVSNGSAWVAQT